jgi:hypothetical protein
MGRDYSGSVPQHWCDRCGDSVTGREFISYVRVTIGVPIEYDICCVPCLGELAYCYAPVSVGYVGKSVPNIYGTGVKG